MYLHMGNNRVIKTKSIIGVFDLDNSTISSVTRKFLSDADKNKKIINIKDEIPKSFVITDNKIYMTQVSTQTLLSRVNQ